MGITDKFKDVADTAGDLAEDAMGKASEVASDVADKVGEFAEDADKLDGD